MKQNKKFHSDFKVTIIGCGQVGATAGYAMLLDGTPSEIVLIDPVKNKAKGLKADFESALPFINYSKVTASTNLPACADSHLIVITAGARQQEGETRLQLVKKNKTILKQIIPQIAKYAPNSILVIVSNPLDILVYEAIKFSGFPRNRVFGTGTTLDTARLRTIIGNKLKINPSDVNTYVLGEHGDSSFPVFSSANIAGKSISKFKNFNNKIEHAAYQDARDAAYHIIHDLGFTCYSIGTVIREIMIHIFQDSKAVMPLSVKLNGEYGLKNVALSVPCVLGNSGISEIIEVPLNENEKKMLKKSANVLKKYL